MRIADRYIGRAVAGHIGVVMLVLLSIYFFTSLVAETRDVGKGSYELSDALQYTLLLTPRLTYQVFPLTALLGAMLGLGALAGTSELTALRAAGVSIRRIMVSVLKAGLLLVAAVTLLGEFAAPPLEKYAYSERAKALSREVAMNTDDGLWARDGNDFIHIRRLLTGGRASEIAIYRFDDSHRLTQTLFAPRGVYRDDAWHLQQVRVSRIGQEEVTTAMRRSVVWESSLTPAVVDLVSVSPENLSVVDLWGYRRYMQRNGLEDRRYDLAFWTRVTMPFATAGMILLAVPFVFGSLRSVGVGQRIVVGALLGIGFYLFNAVFSRVGVLYDIPPFLAASLPTLLVYAIWAVMMRRVY